MLNNVKLMNVEDSLTLDNYVRLSRIYLKKTFLGAAQLSHSFIDEGCFATFISHVCRKYENNVVYLLKK